MAIVRDVPRDLPVGLYEFLREVQLEIENTDAAISSALENVQSSGSTTIVNGGGGIDPDNRPVEGVVNFAVLPSLRFIALTWDPPSGGNNVSYTEVWRSPDNNPSNMVFIGSTEYPYFVDNVGPGSPEYFYRVRHVRVNISENNQASYVLGAYSNILSGNTPPNLQEVLDLLEGQLSELSLVQSLNDRIDLIDAPGVGLVDGLATETGARIAAFNTLDNAYQAGDAILAQQIQNIVATSGTQVFVQPAEPLDDPVGTIEDGAVWYDTDDNNRTYQWVNDDWVDVTDPRIDQNIAAIQVAQTAIVDLENDKAEASVVTTLQSTVGSQTTLIQQNITAIDGIEGEYAVRIDANGRVAGFGLINNPSTSAFVIAADIFSVGQPGYAEKPLFAIAPINGTPTIVLAADTLIGDAAIENAMVGSLSAEKLFALSGTIADAVIGNGHVTNLMIGNVIQSDNWNATTRQGWRLVKDTGLLEAQGITIFDENGNPIFGTGTGFNLNFTQVNGPTRPADNATVGGTYGVDIQGLPVFEDSFENIDFWEQIDGSGDFGVISDGIAQFGGRALQATGTVRIAAPNFDVPYDPRATYRVRCRIRDMSGSSLLVYVGFAGVAGDRTTLVNRLGDNSYGSQHYVAVNGDNPGTGYTFYEGFLSGYGSPNGSQNSNTLGDPYVAHENVRYLRPLVLLNWNNAGAERMRIDHFVIERVQEQINPANISTYISALAVDTLYIADNAVTIPATGVTSFINHGNIDTVVVQATIDPLGQPVTLNFDSVMRRVQGSAILYPMRIERLSGAGVFTIWGEFPMRMETTGYYQTVNIGLKDTTPGAGPVTYRIIARSNGPANILEWRQATLDLAAVQK